MKRRDHLKTKWIEFKQKWKKRKYERKMENELKKCVGGGIGNNIKTARKPHGEREMNREKAIVGIAVGVMVLLVGAGIFIAGAVIKQNIRLAEYINTGDAYLANGDYESAMEEYTKALEKEEHNPNIPDKLEETYGLYIESVLADGEPEKALSIAEKGYIGISEQTLKEQVEKIKAIIE